MKETCSFDFSNISEMNKKKKTKVQAANHRVSKPTAVLELPRSNTPSHVTQLLDDGGKYRDSHSHS